MDVEFSQRGTLALLAAIGDAPINALMSDGFAESMNFSRMEAISILLADDLSQFDWLPDSVYSSPTDIIITYKKGRGCIFFNITEVNSLLPLLIEMEE